MTNRADHTGHSAAPDPALVAASKRISAKARARMADDGISWVAVEAIGGEFHAQREISEHGFLVYCLTEPRLCRERGARKSKLVHSPSISRLLFVGVEGDPALIELVFEKELATSTDDRPGELLIVPTDELIEFLDRNAVKDRVAFVRQFLPTFSAGTRVEVAEGPFEGYTGNVIRMEHKRVRVSIEGKIETNFAVDAIREAV